MELEFALEMLTYDNFDTLSKRSSDSCQMCWRLNYAHCSYTITITSN